MIEALNSYDAAEREALCHLPNRAIQAFGCFAFSGFGYPFRIQDPRELWRFIDVMHEGHFEHYLRVLKHVSAEELELAAWLATGTFNYSTENFGKAYTGRHCITAALVQLRGIRRARIESPSNTILELGPGSGYLALLMARVGYAVDTVEVSQAFAMHQAHFFQHFLPDTSQVFSSGDYQYHALRPGKKGGIRQIPWWFYGDHNRECDEYTLLTANHALAEFHPDALLYLMKRFGREHFGRYGHAPVIFADTFGAAVTPYNQIETRFNQHGWTYDSKPPFYFMTYEPSRANNQALLTAKGIKYEQTLRRRVKRLVYLSLREKKASRMSESVKSSEDATLKQLRAVFDRLIPNEKTPDEMYVDS